MLSLCLAYYHATLLKSTVFCDFFQDIQEEKGRYPMEKGRETNLCLPCPTNGIVGRNNCIDLTRIAIFFHKRLTNAENGRIFPPIKGIDALGRILRGAVPFSFFLERKNHYDNRYRVSWKPWVEMQSGCAESCGHISDAKPDAAARQTSANGLLLIG